MEKDIWNFKVIGKRNTICYTPENKTFKYMRA